MTIDDYEKKMTILRDKILLFYCEKPSTTFTYMNLSFDFMTYSTSECETAVRLLIEDGFLIKIKNRNSAITYTVKESMKLHILSKAHYGI